MQNRKQFGLLVCLAMMLLASQTLWGQFVVKVNGTDGSGITDTLTLAVDPAGTSSYDSLSPTLREYEIPVAAKGLDFRVASNFPADVIGLGSYTSIHHMAFPTQTDRWKLQFNVDSGRTNFLLQWPTGLNLVGGGVWRVVPDPDDVISFSPVDMTTSTSLSIPVSDIESHTFFIVTGDGQKYRSFTEADLVGALDSKGKAGKAEARKAYASQGTFSWTNTLAGKVAPDTTATDLHIEWSQGIDDATLSISPNSTHTWVDPPKNTKLDIVFPDSIHHNDVVTIFAIGNKGKPLQAKKWWWSIGGVMYPPKVKNLPVDPPDGLLRYHMPNTNNMGEEAYSQTVFTGDGLTIGDPVTPSAFDIKGKPLIKGVIHPKWKDVLKTLSDKTGMQSGPPTCLDFFVNNPTKPIKSKQKSLPPGKHNNALLGEAVTLKVNIGFGAAGKIEEGGTPFGSLVYVRQPGDPFIPPGTMVYQISSKLDSVMRCLPTSWDSTTGPANYAAWYNAAHRINGSFSGPFDTLGFVAPIPPPHPKTAGTVATGTKAIMDVPFLYRTSFAVNLPDFGAPNIAALEARNQPDQYKLMQNYPNPFNPVTTIEFALPEDGLVTLKVYNILGQEVATLINHEVMTSGTNEVTFDATSLASGVYYYRMIFNEGQPNQFMKVMKMMLVK